MGLARNSLMSFIDGVSDEDIRQDIDTICSELPLLEREQVRRAAEVARMGTFYYRLSKGDVNGDPSVENLSQDEKDSIVAERERLFSQRGMLVIIVTVSLAAFLQGHVQSSINAMSLFVETVGIDIKKQGEAHGNGANITAQWQLGAMNAVPFFVAAFPGVLLSLPLNYCLGRRGSLALSALLIIASSVGSGFAITWRQILGARVVGGIGKSHTTFGQVSRQRLTLGIAMGIKAVSAPILASETAVGYWRGSTILAWQLWFVFIFTRVNSLADNLLQGCLRYYDRLCLQFCHFRCYDYSGWLT